MLLYTENYVSDLREIQKVIHCLDKLKNKTVMVTGAGGLICSAIVDFLLELNRDQNYQINVYVAGRNLEKIKKRFKERSKDSGFHYLMYDALKEINTNRYFDYVIHGASNANPGVYLIEPVETMLANFNGINNILNYAKDGKAKKIVYISSSEVYGNKNDGKPYCENDYSYLDILKPRACYPSSKRAAETLCASYYNEYDVNYVIVRPGHVYGPTMTNSDNRASSQFPRDIIAGKDIIMKSEGTQLRSYCYVLDCVSAIMAVMINGEPNNAYNISNKDSIVTIKQMAECFAKAGGKRILYEIASEKEKASYNMMVNSSLTSEKLESLEWRGLFDMETGARRTLNSISNNFIAKD